MTRHQRIAARIRHHRAPDPGDDRAQEKYANTYYGIGHGDYNERQGFAPSYVVWAFLNGRIQTSDTMAENPATGEFEDGATHGGLWGHSITDLTYKGRYEPETGRLSIAVPDRFAQRELPKILMTALERKFQPIKSIAVFH